MNRPFLAGAFAVLGIFAFHLQAPPASRTQLGLACGRRAKRWTLPLCCVNTGVFAVLAWSPLHIFTVRECPCKEGPVHAIPLSGIRSARMMRKFGLCNSRQSDGAAYSSLAFHYIPDFAALVRVLAGLVRPGGTLLFVVFLCAYLAVAFKKDRIVVNGFVFRANCSAASGARNAGRSRCGRSSISRYRRCVSQSDAFGQAVRPDRHTVRGSAGRHHKTGSATTGSDPDAGGCL